MTATMSAWPFEMLVLEERARHVLAVARDVAQMHEMDLRPNASTIAGRSLSGRAPSEPVQNVTPLAATVDRLEHVAVVGGGRHDARQAEQRERRIVGMAAQPDAEPFGTGTTSPRKSARWLRSFSGADAVDSRRDAPTAYRAINAARCPGRPAITLRGEFFCAPSSMPAKRALRLARNRLRDSPRAAPWRFSTMDVEGGEVGQVEAHGAAAMRQTGQVRSVRVQSSTGMKL